MYVASPDPISGDSESVRGSESEVKGPFTIVIYSTGRVQFEDGYIAASITSEFCG